MMTLKELSQLYYLNREIEMDSQRIEELRLKAENASPSPISDMPKSPNMENKMERYVAEMVDLQVIIHAKQQQFIHEQKRLERYIGDIDDSIIRQIFKLRFIKGLNWQQVARKMGGTMTESYVKNTCYKYLRQTNEKDAKDGVDPSYNANMGTRAKM